MSDAIPEESPLCPVGEKQCAVIDELVTIRSDIQALQELVQTDPLTKLGNYRNFSQVIDREMERTQRTGQPTAMILVDLDFFKKVNDNWGHEIGNKALIQTAEILKSAVRKLDVPCRYGGEEFIIVLPSTDLLTSTQVAERLRKLIESARLDTGTESITLTASMGVDIFAHTHNETREEFVARVDALLYQAKESGRNRVCSGIRHDMHPIANVSADEKDALFGIFDSDD